ncbi:MAG: metallophosphoesterase [Cyclobacteriaceae bacterium]
MIVEKMICLFLTAVLLTQDGKAQNEEEKLFSFGVITDVQYADVETVGKRNYRGSLAILDSTLKKLNEYDLEFTVNLGDLIDRDFGSFERPLAILENSNANIYHVWGNHDFSVKDELKGQVGKKLENKRGYHALEKGDFVFLVVNGMDISLEGHPINSTNYKMAESLMEELEANGANNAKPWNGGIGKTQLDWLVKQSEDAHRNGKKVVVFCHYPLFPENGLHLLNHKEVYEKLSETGSLVAWFSGHHHEGNYVKDEMGIHHLTFQGIVEAETNVLGAILSVYQNKLVVHGIGHEKDRILEFR